MTATALILKLHITDPNVTAYSGGEGVTATALNLPCHSTNTVAHCKPMERPTKQALLAIPQHCTAPNMPALV